MKANKALQTDTSSCHAPCIRKGRASLPVPLSSSLGGMEGVHVVRFEVRPQIGSKEYGRVAGAFVNVYTTAPIETEAVNVAKAEIDEAGWQICALKEVFWLSRTVAQQCPDSLPYFEQALIDDIVLVFHTYASDEEDESNAVH